MNKSFSKIGQYLYYYAHNNLYRKNIFNKSIFLIKSKKHFTTFKTNYNTKFSKSYYSTLMIFSTLSGLLSVMFSIIYQIKTNDQDDFFGNDDTFYEELTPFNEKKLLSSKSSINSIDNRFLPNFDDVCGANEAKEELKDIITFLQNPKKFSSMGAKIPKGILFVGAPGTGKTLLARALAGEANVTFLSCNGSSFEQMFVGVGSSRIRRLFERARNCSPCIIFIDEIETLSRNMYASGGAGAINELLVQMDGFHQDQGILVIGSTNMQQIMDPALTRAGRFDRQVEIGLPDTAARKEIILLNFKNKPYDSSIDFDKLAIDTMFLSGADLKNLVNLAAIKSIKDYKLSISQKCVYDALQILRSGRLRTSLHLNDNIINIQAYHECGKALISFYTQGHSCEIEYISILPRGRSLSSNHYSPKSESSFVQKTRENYLAEIDINLAGQVAEEIMVGHNGITNTSSYELQKATSIARDMVIQTGLSKFGKVSFDASFYEKYVSDSLKSLIDQEVQNILKESYNRIYSLLKTKRNEIELLSSHLINKTTLSQFDVIKILNKNDPTDKKDA